MNTTKTFLLLTLVLLCTSFPTRGANSVLADRSLPFTIEADTVTYSDVTQTSQFTGNVILTQGSMRIEAKTIETVVDPEGYQYARAKGGVHFKQKRDGSDEILNAQAEQLLYDGKNNLIVLAKNAQVRRTNAQGKLIDQISANELTYNQLTQVFETNPNDKGRTHVLITPRSGKEAK